MDNLCHSAYLQPHAPSSGPPPNTSLHVKTKVDDREALGRAGSSKIGPHGAHGQSEETNGIEGGVNDAQADKPGQEGSTADLTSNVAAGEGTEAVLPEGSADAPADGRGPGSRDEGRSSGGEDEAAEGIVGGGEYSLDPGSDEEDKGFDEEKAEEVWEKGEETLMGALVALFLGSKCAPAKGLSGIFSSDPIFYFSWSSCGWILPL